VAALAVAMLVALVDALVVAANADTDTMPANRRVISFFMFL
jgi:hypothetical protein